MEARSIFLLLPMFPRWRRGRNPGLVLLLLLLLLLLQPLLWLSPLLLPTGAVSRR